MMDDRNKRDTYKYRLWWRAKIIMYHITSDLIRREIEHQTRWPGSHVEQIGRKTTRKDAIKWWDKRVTKGTP